MSQESYFLKEQKPSMKRAYSTGNIPPPEEAQQLWDKFEENYPGYLAQLTEEQIEDILELYFFIGRLNPPHEGHFEALFQMIDAAQRSPNRKKIIIFAGSGPKSKDKINILNNPIHFDIKKDIIKEILKIKYGESFVNDNILILEMTSVPSQLGAIITEDRMNSITRKIRTIRVAGDKEDDVKKSNYVEYTLEKTVSNLNGKYSPRIQSINPVEREGNTAASATQTRLDALTMAEPDFIQKYLPMYLSLFTNVDDRIIERVRIIVSQIYNGINGRIYNAIQTGEISEEDKRIYIESNGKAVAQTKSKKLKGGFKTKKKQPKKKQPKKKQPKKKQTKKKQTKRRN